MSNGVVVLADGDIDKATLQVAAAGQGFVAAAIGDDWRVVVFLGPSWEASSFDVALGKPAAGVDPLVLAAAGEWLVVVANDALVTVGRVAPRSTRDHGGLFLRGATAAPLIASSAALGGTGDVLAVGGSVDGVAAVVLSSVPQLAAWRILRAPRVSLTTPSCLQLGPTQLFAAMRTSLLSSIVSVRPAYY
jgi:hypothetical protein